MNPSKPLPTTWLTRWEPEDPQFWEAQGKVLAWRTLWITTFNLTLAFITWFVVSALVVRLPNVGFQLSTSQLFWLAAMPGLAGGTLRIIWTFLPPILGTRHLVTYSTLLLLVPLLGWAWAVQNTATPFWVLMVLAFLAGIGGGNFSGFMPSTSYFFPKKLQGTALGIQAGVGNFGVSVVQFVTPWIIGFALLGSLLGDPQTFTKGEVSKPIWLQNATLVYVPLVLLGAALAWFWLKSVPVRANFREQFDIFGDKHTWIMTSLYIMTFGSFSGFSATFPLLIRTVYGKFEGAPDPLAFAFLGPLVGSLLRVLMGPLTDRYGGAIWTQVSGIGLLISAIGVTFFLRPVSLEQFPWFVFFMLLVFLFSGIGNASTFKQMPMIFEPRKAGGVIGWTAAIAAYGPFVFSSLIGAVIGSTGSAAGFFYGAAVFYAINVLLNWYYYARRGAEKPC
ncbi:MAG: MFS transporter [Meiothermus ruber]|jgi:NNP family nitrate/nitrite transporter-like MFS transporter|uniref:Nitrate/nitrite transporter n=1 Tax=Meiothermus ruber TaxID=277 RepID=A0A7C3DI55_MEIRU|nr:MAG: nitrate/nitrite transporter [Meiothermus sp.]